MRRQEALRHSEGRRCDVSEEHPLRKERIGVRERRVVKAFALQKTTAMAMPSATTEEMALLSLLSWRGDSIDCAIRFPVLKDLRDGIDKLLRSIEAA